MREAWKDEKGRLALLEALLHNNPVGCAFVDRAFSFTYANDAFAAAYGLPVASLLEMTMPEVDPKGWPVLESVYRRVLAGETIMNLDAGPMHRQARLYPVHRQGEIIGMGIVVSSINGPNLDEKALTGAGGNAIDVSEASRDAIERRRAEEALLESEERFSGAFEHAPIGVALVSPEGRWLKVNRALCELVGYSEAELLARTFQDITHPEDLEVDLENLRRTIAGEIRSYQIEKRYIHGRGHLITVLLNVSLVRDGHGQPRYFISQIQDITARKQAEEALRESNEKFRHLVDNITDAFWIRSPDLSEVQYVSPAFERIWGRSVESLHASPHEWVDFILPEDRERVVGAFAALTANAPSLDVEYRIMRPNGEIRWVHVRGFQVRDATGQLIRHTGIVTDITERKRAQAELENSHTQLVEASRLGGMAEIATNMLHNVGNVLNSVNISTGLIVEGVKKFRTSSLAQVVLLLQEHADDLGAFMTNDSKGNRLPAYLAQLSEQLMADKQAILGELDSLERNIEHIKGIVAMQQNLAGIGGVKEMINVVNLMEDSLSINEDSLRDYRLEIIREFEQVPSMIVEKHKVLQILVNLVRNAKHACEESERADKRLIVRVVNGDGRVRISVIDNGIGILPENLTRIFNHGFTTRKDGHGFGLHSGVLTARELGGSLSVHSDGLGQGATFTLELPLQQS